MASEIVACQAHLCFGGIASNNIGADNEEGDARAGMHNPKYPL